MKYVISEKVGAVFYKEAGEIMFMPLNADDTFYSNEATMVETWEDVDPAEKDRITNALD